MSGDFHLNYYNQAQIWGNVHEKIEEKERLQETLKMIPVAEIESVLDIGCGDGALTNSLISLGLDVTALDISEEALKHVNTSQKIITNSANLPFNDQSFDLIVCTEVIEHLPQSEYQASLKEIERVAKNFIVISTPFRENLRQRFGHCPNCGCIYHIYRHLRSFTEEKYQNMFSQFQLVNLRKVGPIEKRYSNLELFLKINLGKGYTYSPTAVCPACGTHKTSEFKWTIFSIMGELMFKIRNNFAPKHEKWIIGLYTKQ